MNPNEEDPFRHLDLNEAIDLRWTLRDVRARRWVLTPLNPSHIETLLSMGLIEIRDEFPVLTNAGVDAVI